ncbi:MAG: hypothetical protein HYX68_16465 [Planctomycetes bacterium]|jgi:hypothetical protein|nr:hypothetical protein [Planctomycetota bacterium]
MHEHGPDELLGPVRGTAAWWRGMAAEVNQDDETTPAHEEPTKKHEDARPMRTDLINRIRKEIAAGTYDSPERWEAALDSMLDTFGG